MMIRLLIADDERLEREALAEMVTRRFVKKPRMAARQQIRRSCGGRTSS